jgi:transcriptional regulator with XRE-family HTH domain
MIPMPRDIINPSIQPTKGLHYLIGERIAKARKAMHVTLREFAGITGMSMMQVSQIERGEVLPSILDLLPFIEYAAREVVEGRETIKELDAHNPTTPDSECAT